MNWRIWIIKLCAHVKACLSILQPVMTRELDSVSTGWNSAIRRIVSGVGRDSQWKMENEAYPILKYEILILGACVGSFKVIFWGCWSVDVVRYYFGVLEYNLYGSCVSGWMVVKIHTKNIKGKIITTSWLSVLWERWQACRVTRWSSSRRGKSW